jgi:hypothetical protein
MKPEARLALIILSSATACGMLGFPSDSQPAATSETATPRAVVPHITPKGNDFGGLNTLNIVIPMTEESLMEWLIENRYLLPQDQPTCATELLTFNPDLAARLSQGNGMVVNVPPSCFGGFATNAAHQLSATAMALKVGTRTPTPSAIPSATPSPIGSPPSAKPDSQVGDLINNIRDIVPDWVEWGVAIIIGWSALGKAFSALKFLRRLNTDY